MNNKYMVCAVNPNKTVLIPKLYDTRETLKIGYTYVQFGSVERAYIYLMSDSSKVGQQMRK